MPTQPWKKNNDDARHEDSLPTYIIFCEDKVHEPEYFGTFNVKHDLKIVVIPDQGQNHFNFFNTVKQCFKDKRMAVVNGSYKVIDELMENIWCVYDRDTDLTQSNIKQRDNFFFTNAIKSAADCGLNVAWSNDAFELWVLLHFEEVPAEIAFYRDNIYNRLTEVFRNLPNSSEGLANIVGQPDFHYKTHLKRRPNFSQHVLPLLHERSNAAIENATALEAIYSHDTPFHDRNPCTMVHHLVRELLAFQQQ